MNKKELSAGGVVYKVENGTYHFLMIHDRFGKVTLAKGKIEAGETLEECALREILEETAVRGKLIELLEVVHYEYQHASTGEMIDKEVHYYLVEALTDELTAQVEEINGVEWMPAQAAWQAQLTKGYDNNRSVIQKALSYLKIEV
ncbi:NUDIX hydrolase [Brevibacillus dissolubilis]|uniref:NUDIX hydrolase n=1 Tax=Brevibacillus dissolubilis TaxID=1844116 RepID=UPI00111649EF|nr:NUDIX domain-containing protein [Brevibacillus dissolubilis]